MDAIVVHSEHGAARLRDELGLDPARVHVIAHGALDGLTAQPDDAAPPPELRARRRAPWCCSSACCGPTRASTCCSTPGGGRTGRPARSCGSPGCRGWTSRSSTAPDVRTALRFVSGAELAGAFRAADLVVLPYREIDQSGVLFTALAFGKPLLLTAVGGFPEIAATGRRGARRRPATRTRSPERSARCWPTRRGCARMAAAVTRRRGRPVRLGRDRPPHARALRGAPGVDRGSAAGPGPRTAARSRSSPVSTKPVSSATRCGGEVVLVDQQLDQLEPQLCRAPSRAAASPPAWRRRARALRAATQ